LPKGGQKKSANTLFWDGLKSKTSCFFVTAKISSRIALLWSIRNTSCRDLTV